MSDLVIEGHDAAGLRAMREPVLAVYRQVYADQLGDPFRTPERFWERLDAYASRDGFGMVCGHVAGEMVGFALGYPLPARSRWWKRYAASTKATKRSPGRTVPGRSRSTS
ncbi:hypothetical protein ACFQ1L_30900 [Phytohabitans flavus]|uniref:hypothetical protein n=1 Tax=Phytohabitans flavus TaxID=1076124 RepID=UPI00362EF0A8